MAETKSFFIDANVEDILSLQTIKGVDNPYVPNKEKQILKETELVRDNFIKADTVIGYVFHEGDNFIIIYEDKPLKEKYIEIYLKPLGKRFFGKTFKEIKKKILLEVEDENLEKEINSLLEKVKNYLENTESGVKFSVAGALISKDRLLPFAVFPAKNTIQNIIKQDKVKALQQEIDELLAQGEEEKAREKREELRKYYQPYLPLAISKSEERGDYLKQSSETRLGENINRATEGGQFILLVPILGVANGKLTYRRIAFVPTNAVATELFRRKLNTYRNALTHLLQKKENTARELAKKDRSLERRLTQLIDFYKNATDEEKEEIKKNVEEVGKAVSVLNSIIFPKQLINIFAFENLEVSNEEEFKEFNQKAREMEKKIYGILGKYTPQLKDIARILVRAEGRKVKIRRDTGIEEEEFYLKNLPTKSIYTTIFIKSIAKKINIDIEPIAEEIRNERLKFKGKSYELGNLVYAFINQYIGLLAREYLKEKGLKEIENDKQFDEIKQIINNLIEYGRKYTTVNKPVSVEDIEIEELEELLLEHDEGLNKELEKTPTVTTEEKSKQSEWEQEEPDLEDIEKMLLGDDEEEEKEEEDIEGLEDLL
jgi:hypothetical protein